MKAEEVRQQLLKAQTILEQAVEQLVKAPADLCYAALDDVAKRLKAAVKDAQSVGGDQESRELLKKLQERCARIQLLLDSAVMFYCGSLWSSRSMISYTPDGRADGIGLAGHLNVKG